MAYSYPQGWEMGTRVGHQEGGGTPRGITTPWGMEMLLHWGLESRNTPGVSGEAQSF